MTIAGPGRVQHRVTARHDSVRQALAAAGTFISAQDLHAQLRSAGHRIGLTTVYRALAAMADNGGADVLTADGQQVYRACGSGSHHHHLICRSCGKTVEISGPAIERWAKATASKYYSHCFSLSERAVAQRCAWFLVRGYMLSSPFPWPGSGGEGGEPGAVVVPAGAGLVPAPPG